MSYLLGFVAGVILTGVPMAVWLWRRRRRRGVTLWMGQYVPGTIVEHSPTQWGSGNAWQEVPDAEAD